MIVTPAQPDEVYGVSFLPGDDTFLIGLRNGDVRAWESRHGKMIAPPEKQPDQEAVYTISVAPDRSCVIIVSRDPKVRAFSISHWQADVKTDFASDELVMLGETIAVQELHEGVMAGISSESILNRWNELLKKHTENQIFRWKGAIVQESAE